MPKLQTERKGRLHWRWFVEGTTTQPNQVGIQSYPEGWPFTIEGKARTLRTARWLAKRWIKRYGLS